MTEFAYKNSQKILHIYIYIYIYVCMYMYMYIKNNTSIAIFDTDFVVAWVFEL